jgi:hypothetical protein
LHAHGSSRTAVVHEALDELWPGRFGAEALSGDVSLGHDGLGLDSIELVELVIECQERVGLPTSEAVGLLEAGPLTLGRLIDHLDGA